MSPRAVNDDIIVKLVSAKESTHGIIIPDQAKAGSAEFHGIVISVGNDCPYELEKNQKVLFSRHEGIEITENGERYLRLQPSWVLGILHE